MPAVPPNEDKLVLVSGASGFLGAFVTLKFLSHGYKVRGTVRSKEKGEYLVKLFEKKSLKGFEYVIVEDIEAEGAFDKAVEGADAVAHTASPFHFKVEDPHKDLINPAVNGTLNMLKSIKAHGPSVKRVVITSSFASIVVPEPKKGDSDVYTFTEKDWNTYSPAQIEEKGKDATPADAYRASKTLAERAAWKFVEDEKPNFDIGTINPPLILGPTIHQTSASSLNTSTAQFYAYINGSKSEGEELNKAASAPASNAVDVRDVAEAHVQVIAKDAGGGERWAISTGPYVWQDVLDSLSSIGDAKVPKGQPGAGKKVKQNILSGSKAEKGLGLKYIGFDEMCKDTYESLREREKANWE